MGGVLTADVEERTSNIPFVALLLGRQGEGAFSQLLSEAKLLNAGLAAGVAALWTLKRLPR